MAIPGRNEGVRVLDELVCEAVSTSGSAPPGYRERGADPGLESATESISRPSQGPPVPAERVAELRRLSTTQLLALVRLHAPDLSSQELLVIHGIAAERLGDDRPPPAGAVELSQEVMIAAVNRSA